MKLDEIWHHFRIFCHFSNFFRSFYQNIDRFCHLLHIVVKSRQNFVEIWWKKVQISSILAGMK